MIEQLQGVREGTPEAACSSRKSETRPVSGKLIDEARGKYGVGPCYAQAYLEYWQQTRNRSFAKLDEILAVPPPDPMWFEYAMSSRARGREFYQFVKPRLLGHERRYLDVGCGFGGCLAAFAENGMEVCGVEIDPQRVELSRATCRDIQLNEVVHNTSIQEENLASRIGTFDVITCLDVIEHVLDVPESLARMYELLNPGGLLILEIPNKDAVSFVCSDGHFNLFGITQLDREPSIAYHKRFFSFEYDVGYYFPLDYYDSLLSGKGMWCQTMASPFHELRCPDSLPRLGKMLARAYAKYLLRTARHLPPSLNAQLNFRLGRYMASLAYNAAKRRLGRLESSLYEKRFLTDFWVLLARKPSSSESR